MKDQHTKQRQAWIDKLQKRKIKRNRQMAVPLCEPVPLGVQVMLRNFGGVR